MTESEYKTVVKLMIEKLEQCRDEIAEKEAEIEMLQKEIAKLDDINTKYAEMLDKECDNE